MHSRFLYAALAVCSALPTERSAAQSSGDVPRLIQLLGSTSPNRRSAAFDTHQRTPRAWTTPAAAAELLRMLESEDQVIATTVRAGNGVGEGFGEYASAVLEACLAHCDKAGHLAHMLRQVAKGSPVRFDAIGVLGGVADRFSPAQRLVIDSALLVAAQDSLDWMSRSAALGALGTIARSDSGLPVEWRARIHRAAAAAMSDKNVNVRLAAVRRLYELGDSTDLPLLRRVAAGDPHLNISHGREVYPVRVEALKVIAKIAPP